MTTTRFAAALAALGLFSAAAAQPASAAPSPVPGPKITVSVMRMGEDETSKVFGDTIAQTFAATSVFDFVQDGAQVKVQLDPIDNPPSGDQGAFTFKVEITPQGGETTLLSSNCYTADMADCAGLVVERTYGAVKRAQTSGK